MERKAPLARPERRPPNDALLRTRPSRKPDQAAKGANRFPRFPLVQRKRWGVALLALPERFDGYFAGKARLALRRKRRRATELGECWAARDRLGLSPVVQDY
jgi:hypothetical protein